MKSLLLSGVVMAALLSGCGKEPAPAPAQPAPAAAPATAPAAAPAPATTGAAPAPAAPAAVLTDEEKMKIVNEAKKKANKGG